MNRTFIIADTHFGHKNIHGHLHSNKLDDPRYINVSAEHTGLAPVLLDTLPHNFTESQK